MPRLLIPKQLFSALSTHQLPKGKVILIQGPHFGNRCSGKPFVFVNRETWSNRGQLRRKQGGRGSSLSDHHERHNIQLCVFEVSQGLSNDKNCALF